MILFWLLMAGLLILAVSFIVLPLLRKPQQYPRLAIVLTLFISIVAMLLYRQWGHAPQLAAWHEQTHAQQQLLAQYGSIEQLIAQLQAQLAKHSDSAQGWYLLGKLCLNTQRYTEAAAAFAKANQLQPRDVTILLPYAQTLMLLNDKQADAVLKEILVLQPDNAIALQWVAMVAKQTQR